MRDLLEREDPRDPLLICHFVHGRDIAVKY